MKPLESYLRKATGGLWGYKRLEVWRELEANINLKVQELQIEGLTREEALEKALTEMGNPQTLSAGMRGVHLMPKLMRSTTLLLLLMSLSMLIVSPSQAQLTPVAWRDYKVDERPILVETEAVKNELEKQGIKFQTYQGRMEGIKPSEMFKINEGGYVGVTIQQDGKSYIPVSTLIIIALENTRNKGRLEGWETLKFSFGNPVLGIKNTQLTFGSPQQPINPYFVYYGLVFQKLWPALKITNPVGVPLPSTRSEEFISQCIHSIKVNAPAGTVMGLVGRYFFGRFREQSNNRVIDLAPVKADGTVDLVYSQPNIQFANNLEVLSKPGAAFETSVVLIRLTGDVISDGGAWDNGAGYVIYTPQAKTSVVSYESCGSR